MQQSQSAHLIFTTSLRGDSHRLFTLPDLEQKGLGSLMTGIKLLSPPPLPSFFYRLLLSTMIVFCFSEESPYPLPQKASLFG
ncbi:hypothetical protein TNIN_387521 [Trichonephila inaurata madagascariensis]|uniref:Uncharacterized protein n=1 Tax=Trichonephila inaurata madagascariensis TaxID=2747483 RepID=A0A8X6X1S8_9ARAC|nr:hypothetical protein TNIN_387521 [Trichonephila inaurata madagascariensis]